MIIKANSKDYAVEIYEDFSFIKQFQQMDNTFYVVDKLLYEIYRNRLFSEIPLDRLYIVEAKEDNKTIETALNICEVMTGMSAKRNTHLVSFGGGIIQDITGFVANILYRGIYWDFIPTTLLAACDSCIGGKTSLNYKHYKNLLGTFYPPDKIHICSEFFNTLSEKDFQSGMGEVVKFNIMYGEDGLRNIEKNMDRLMERDQQLLNQFIESSLSFKKSFIEEDEFDRGVRVQLNFAHTFGHAFETVSNYGISHGTAVAMGMIVADRISAKRGLLDDQFVMRAEKILKRIIHVDEKYLQFSNDKIMDAIRKDKKQTSTALTAVLMTGDRKLTIFKDLTAEEIQEAVESMITVLRQDKR